MNTALYLDQFLFGILPYIVAIAFIPATVYRYRARGFTYSSLSSQFLENQQHFWGLVPFHYGILVVTLGHLVAFLLPQQLLAWNSRPLRLYVLEVSGLIFAVLSLIGLSAAVVRRFSASKVRCVTTTPDWILFALLIVQIASGIGVAVFYPWGSSWFAAAVTPYLWSLVKLNPNLTAIAAAAAADQVPHRDCIPRDRMLPLYSPGSRPRDPESVPVAQAAGGALVREAACLRSPELPARALPARRWASSSDSRPWRCSGRPPRNSGRLCTSARWQSAFSWPCRRYPGRFCGSRFPRGSIPAAGGSRFWCCSRCR